MTFRTNRKDRQLFAQALGLVMHPHWSKKSAQYPCIKGGCLVLARVDHQQGKWEFHGNGFEWCIQEFCRRNNTFEVQFDFEGEGFFCGIWHIGFPEMTVDRKGKSIGEAFFRAVVEFERGK